MVDLHVPSDPGKCMCPASPMPHDHYKPDVVLILDVLLRIEKLLESMSFPVAGYKDGKWVVSETERALRVNVANEVEVTGSVATYDRG